MKRLSLLALLCATFAGVMGCGDDKPKKPANIEGELKPLPTPGSPGGGGEKTKKGPGGGNSTQ